LRLYYIPRRQLKNLSKRKSEEWETNNKSEVRACPFSFRLAQADFEPQLYLYKYLSSLLPAILLFHTTCEDGTVGSETSARELQTPGNHPKERIQHMMWYDMIWYLFTAVGFPPSGRRETATYTKEETTHKTIEEHRIHKIENKNTKQRKHKKNIKKHTSSN